MYVCVYVCMYMCVCLCLCVFVCMCVYRYLCIGACMFYEGMDEGKQAPSNDGGHGDEICALYIYVFLCGCMHAPCVYVCIDVCWYVWLLVYVCVNVGVCVYVCWYVWLSVMSDPQPWLEATSWGQASPIGPTSWGGGQASPHRMHSPGWKQPAVGCRACAPSR